MKLIRFFPPLLKGRIKSSNNWRLNKDSSGKGHHDLDKLEKLTTEFYIFLENLDLSKLIILADNFKFNIHFMPIEGIDDSDLSIYASAFDSALLDMVYLFLIHKNYSKIYSNKLIKSYFHIMLVRGKGTLRKNLIELNFFEIETKNREQIPRQYFEQLNKERKEFNDRCPFSQLSKNFKNTFFEILWNFIENKLFPELQRRYLHTVPILVEGIEIKNEKIHLFTLFHLGLLSKFEQGELK